MPTEISSSPEENVRNRLQGLVAQARSLPPLCTAIVHPCDRLSLQGVERARQAGLIVPILVGPETRIRHAADNAGIKLEHASIIDAPHSHAAAETAAILARDGKIDAIMKGSLHTDELLSAVVSADNGIRTNRRMSHVFVIDVPAYRWPLLLTDAVVNIAPTLEDKRDICQNAIDLAHDLGISRPRVAILAATETVNSAMPATIDAAALCKMADRGQIIGGILDGPLAFDNAVNAEAAQIKHITSPVAGHADILVVPNIEAGNMLAKELEYLTGAGMAGLALGARVPIILTSRADKADARLASTALACLHLAGQHARHAAKWGRT